VKKCSKSFFESFLPFQSLKN